MLYLKKPTWLSESSGREFFEKHMVGAESEWCDTMSQMNAANGICGILMIVNNLVG